MAQNFRPNGARPQRSLTYAVSPVVPAPTCTERDVDTATYGGEIVYAGLPETIRRLIDDTEAKTGR